MAQIRPIALAYIEHQGKWLVQEGYDPIKALTFYRFLGGGIEFQEISREAIARELREEIGAIDITVKELVLVHEDIFDFHGKPTHLIEFIYRVVLESRFHELNEVPQNENGTLGMAKWIDQTKFLNRELVFYPEVFLDQRF
ncbi:MAG: NUDIX domain-containing protein [Chitinophagales bacterium]|jgi:8-oxo-dGTP pyrophosphatase MutT (NUDIX family)|nr:NUDIX domain-containing protein [Chitinophagales bacterium]